MLFCKGFVSAAHCPRRERSVFTCSHHVGANTHTFEDVGFELVEDLPYGLHMRLQVLGVLRHSSQCRRQDRAQIESQDAVHGVAGKRGLRRGTKALLWCPFDSFSACVFCPI